MTPTEDLVRLGLSSPRTLAVLSLSDWDLLIRQARSAGVLGRLQALLEQTGLLDQVPAAPRNHLEAARKVALSRERIVRWEIYCIQRALASLPTEVVLLKGAAYILANLPPAGGRLQSDVDILVPKSEIHAVESALLGHGWKNLKFDKYDQRYYRRWMHELPPLYHPQRGTVVDVHHNILPETSRLRPSPEKLLQAAEFIAGTHFKRLCAADMVLHTSAHMFQDGDLERGLRELGDLDGLLRAFGVESGFWRGLLDRAVEMDLHRPLFYALRYSRRFLQTPVPENVIVASKEWEPPALVLGLMDRLVTRALVPKHSTTATFGTDIARWLLYVRSHWLRMPPFLLARHLLHQAVRGLFPNRSGTLP